jgi:anionic cell wall polymer biosynthesis LytR-Cps2A-Psr (LCP) family protein
LRDKLTNPNVITKIPDLIRSFQGAIQTDLSPEQLGQLACIGTQIQSGNIVFATFPSEHFKQTRQYDPVFKKNVFVWDVDFQVLRDYISQFNSGTWPAQTTSPNVQAASPEERTICP